MTINKFNDISNDNNDLNRLIDDNNEIKNQQLSDNQESIIITEDELKGMKKDKPGANFLKSLLAFVATFGIGYMIMPKLRSMGFDYGTIQNIIVPGYTGLTIFMGYRAESKLKNFIASKLNKEIKLDSKGGKKL